MDCRGFDEVQRTLGVLAVTWGLVACGLATPLPARPQTVDEEKSMPAVTVVSPPEKITMTPTPQAAEVTPPAEADRVIQLARQDLAKKQGLSIETIRVVSVEAVEWPDTSLGCPQPGMMYAQMITPGFRVVLAVKDQTVEYHTNMDRSVVLCAKAK